MSQESVERLARLNEYLAEAMKDPESNRLYIADLQETIKMFAPSAIMKRMKSL